MPQQQTHLNESPGVLGWLTSTLGGDATLAGYAPGGVWRGMAPDGTATPYVIVARQGGRDLVLPGAIRVWDDATYLVKVVGPATQDATLASAASRIDALLQGASGTNGSDTRVLSCEGVAVVDTDELIAGASGSEVWRSLGRIWNTLAQPLSGA